MNLIGEIVFKAFFDMDRKGIVGKSVSFSLDRKGIVGTLYIILKCITKFIFPCFFSHGGKGGVCE